MNLDDPTPEERFEFLIKQRHIPTFETITDRKMASGWKKRIEHHKKSLIVETKYIQALKKEGIDG